MRIQENLEKSKYEADGSIQIQGTTIPYHTICEDNFFVDEENNPVASIFSYAYFRSDIQDNSKRPKPVPTGSIKTKSHKSNKQCGLSSSSKGGTVGRLSSSSNFTILGPNNPM